MNRLIKALSTITSWMERMNIPYMVFGGIANSIYGNPRQTFDVDIKFSLESKDNLEQFVEELKSIATLLPDKPIQFIKETNVIPIEIDDVRVDLVAADLPFEIEAIQRSRYVDFSNTNIKVCLPEDLIIQKVVSTREKDWLDIKNIIENQRDNMDWNYLLKHCRELSKFLSKTEIYDRVEKWKNEE
jgi:hypothetical protein